MDGLPGDVGSCGEPVLEHYGEESAGFWRAEVMVVATYNSGQRPAQSQGNPSLWLMVWRGRVLRIESSVQTSNFDQRVEEVTSCRSPGLESFPSSLLALAAGYISSVGSTRQVECLRPGIMKLPERT